MARVKLVNAAKGLPRGRSTRVAPRAIGNPTITTANTVIGMPRIDTPKADNDVMKIVSPVENARISAADSRIVRPTTRARVQYPTANNAPRAKTARYRFRGTTATRKAGSRRTAVARPTNGHGALGRAPGIGNICACSRNEKATDSRN